MYGELDGASTRALLYSHTIGRIGCVYRGQPYIFPVNYTFDGANIICQTDEGVKLNILRHHKKVCFQVDAIITAGSWKSLLALGAFEELHGHDADEARVQLHNRIFPGHVAESLMNAGNDPGENVVAKKKVRGIIFRIEIDSITGRYAK